MDSTRNYYSVILIYTSHALTKGGIAYNFEITERTRKKILEQKPNKQNTFNEIAPAKTA